ncbi:MAG: shikimate kinase [Paracoccaceae bacterium]|nr:shikimate kinase [Paracoccaceae bacterium]
MHGRVSANRRERAGRKEPMAPRLRKTVALVGMMGAGKTAVGTALARRLAVPFLDSDAEIEAAARMEISEIFARDGEAFFRRKESQVIARLLEGPPCVLSTGGGAWLQEVNRRTISAGGIAVWLDADLEVLWSRVRGKETRPLLRTDDPRATLAALAEARRPAYAAADLAVRSDAETSVAEMVDRVVAALSTRPDVLEGA